jgi:hypothetical protein
MLFPRAHVRPLQRLHLRCDDLALGNLLRVKSAAVPSLQFRLRFRSSGIIRANLDNQRRASVIVRVANQ